jgi:cephalosporin-C deacetylase
MNTLLRLTTLLVLAGALGASDLAIIPDHADGVYALGAPITWTITGGTGADQPYAVMSGGRTQVANGSLHFVNGKATVQGSLAVPGTLLLTVMTGVNTYACGGAVIDWTRIAPARQAPTDFDGFWRDQIASLRAIPASAELIKVESGDDGVDLWKITMNHINGSHIHGYLARPKGNAPCPAQLVFPGAGVRGIKPNWPVSLARSGWMALVLLAHDLPVDEQKKYYDDIAEGNLKDYEHRGAEDREKSYFRGMYLSSYRGADYLAGRPDWDGKTLAVSGNSQGGMQALITAALNPAVTKAVAGVPAGCDYAGEQVGRAPGWPDWVGKSTGKERQARLVASGYYDVVNFAARVKVPTLVSVGLADTVAPPAGVIAMYNNLGGKKNRLVIMPTAEHGKGDEAYQRISNEWLSYIHIEKIRDQIIARNTSSLAIPFKVSPDAAQLSVKGSSSNPGLVASSGIVIGGAKTSRTVTVTPTTGKSGQAHITLSVTTKWGETENMSFQVTVNAPPTISRASATENVITLP